MAALGLPDDRQSGAPVRHPHGAACVRNPAGNPRTVPAVAAHQQRSRGVAHRRWRACEALNRLGVHACTQDRRRAPAKAAGNVENLIQQKARLYIRQVRMMTTHTLQSLETVSRGLAKIPARKTVVFLTEGFFAEDNRSDLEAIAAQAARNGITISQPIYQPITSRRDTRRPCRNLTEGNSLAITLFSHCIAAEVSAFGRVGNLYHRGTGHCPDCRHLGRSHRGLGGKDRTTDQAASQRQPRQRRRTDYYPGSNPGRIH